MLDTEGRHPAVQEFRDMFEYDHLEYGLPQDVSAGFHDVAVNLLFLLPDGPGLTRALNKLWEAKNEAVFLAVRTQRAMEAEEASETGRG
jgi:hypothetical protein